MKNDSGEIYSVTHCSGRTDFYVNDKKVDSITFYQAVIEQKFSNLKTEIDGLRADIANLRELILRS